MPVSRRVILASALSGRCLATKRTCTVWERRKHPRAAGRTQCRAMRQGDTTSNLNVESTAQDDDDVTANPSVSHGDSIDPLSDLGNDMAETDTNTLRGDQSGASTSSIEDKHDPLMDVLTSPDFLRQWIKSQDAQEALQVISDQVDANLSSVDPPPHLQPNHMSFLLRSSLERDRVDLALSVYDAMASNVGMSRNSYQGGGIADQWPVADVQTVSDLVLGLCQYLKVTDAVSVMKGIQRRGLPKSDEIPFGHVVDCPLSPYAPLTVIQPEEGAKTVSCAATRYQFEVFSGKVVGVESEALNREDNILVKAAKFTGLWKAPTVQAVHEMVVAAPDGTGRTYRFGTMSPDLPAREGERVSVISAPTVASGGGLLDPSPPGCKPGEPLALSNHKSNVVTELLRPPVSATESGVPGWVVPLAVILAGSDVATAFIDPSLPFIVAVGTASVVGTAVAGNQLLLPRLKQLPERSVQLERVRQELLTQHKELIEKILASLQEASEEIRTLAKLWQLETKMASVGTAGKYDARIERIHVARENLEKRIKGRVELLDGFSRVAKMIEIEVEMDVEVPMAELQGIEEQLEKLAEVEVLQEEMGYQAEAQDEVERLLRATQ